MANTPTINVSQLLGTGLSYANGKIIINGGTAGPTGPSGPTGPTGPAGSSSSTTGTIVTSGTTYNIPSGQTYTVIRKTTGSPTLVHLPASPTAWSLYQIKDGTGDAGTNNITVIPATGNIDNAGNYVMMYNNQSATFVYDGTEWIIV